MGLHNNLPNIFQKCILEAGSAIKVDEWFEV